MTSTAAGVARLRPVLTRIRERYTAMATPSENGLPRARVLLAFPAVLLVLGVILIALGINGTSSGAYHSAVYEGSDPDLIAGSPQAIRSDEWNVYTSWAISQVEQGLPERSGTFPGGMDAAIPQDLPRRDWSVAFRPHLIGYTFLDLDQATAWKWWVPALALIAAAYCFVVSILPRRPGMAAAIAIGFYFSPFFQWWFLPGTHWPAAWALATMAGIVWAFARSSWRSRWIWAAVIAYLTVVMAMSLYAPFIVPVVLVVPFFAAGLLVERLRRGESWRAAVPRILPIGAAAVASTAITLLWLSTKLETVDDFLGTAYPGERLTPTGSGGALAFIRTIAASFSEALNRDAGFLGTNSSEASTFFYIGIFLIPVVGWAIYHSARARRTLPWPLIGLLACVALFAAFVFIPGWDAVAHLLFLDRSTESRLRIGLGVASLGLLVYLIRYLDGHAVRAPRLISTATAGTFLLAQSAIAAAVFVVGGPEKLWGAAPFWWADALVSALAILLIARGRPVAGIAAFAAVTILSTIAVNPVYRGVFDLRETPVVTEVMAIDDADPGAWVGVGTSLPTAMLQESGVRAYNGLQGAPSDEMWEQIDPSGAYEFNWNRLGGVNWVPEAGDVPRVFNPAPDLVYVTFDACNDFAQRNVDYVLTDVEGVDDACLSELDSFKLPGSTATIYRVVPAD